MKKVILFCTGAVLMAASCTSKFEEETAVETGTNKLAALTVNIRHEEPASKADYIVPQPYEDNINEVQILVFDEKERLNVYENAGNKSTVSITTTQGEKTIWVVANGPDLSEVKDISTLKATQLDLSANSTDPEKGFVMAGAGTCSLTGANGTATVNISRLTSRIAVQSIKNELNKAYGDLTIDYIYISNVVGTQSIDGNLSCDPAIATWYNKMGRKDGGEADAIIDGKTYIASVPELTFKASGVTVANGSTEAPDIPYLFYCYPNNTTTDTEGFSSSFTARRTKLIVAATITTSEGAERFYYPISLDKTTIERNKTYAIDMTISGLGSTDPDQEIKKGAIAITIAPDGWTTGADYTENL